jgi:hypothetical protein
MNDNKIKDAFSKINASEEFKNSLKNNLKRGAISMETKNKISYTKPLAAAAAAVILTFGAIQLYPKLTKEPPKVAIVTPNYESVTIPKVELPKEGSGTNGKMMPLIVYNGNVYLMSPEIIDAAAAEKMLGEKLGTTMPTITEWSKQTEYSKEFASTVGTEDVYTVKGFDKSFRIMTYTKLQDGSVYPQLFECLNGITVKTGADVLGKLNLKDNVTKATFNTYDEWNNGSEASHPIKNTDLLNSFLGELNNTAPYLQEKIAAEIEGNTNNDSYRVLTLEFTPGGKTTLTVYKNGYIHYGYNELFFKMNSDIFQKFWNELK